MSLHRIAFVWFRTVGCCFEFAAAAAMVDSMVGVIVSCESLPHWACRITIKSKTQRVDDIGGLFPLVEPNVEQSRFIRPVYRGQV
eukprot:scaffold145_cov173-Amphora_coffeaeformis.AAC.8